MKKLVLVDGNNLMFRSFYATIYNGNIMKNSKGFPTNALFGFVSMINKIIEEEHPLYMAVAFDIGKNFRKEEYDFYKEGRAATPDELKMQMPIARDILDAMGIKHFELAPYEADDIIGTIVKMTEEDKEFASLIVSSDKDLLQLISNETEVKLLKQTGFIRYNHDKFKEGYNIEPIRMIDLKALMGDASDNIPGVKGIGEKTALKLLQQYETVENLYENIDSITGKVKEKLLNDKKMAFTSKKIATIYKDVPLNIVLEDLKYEVKNNKDLINIYEELEFSSLLKNMSMENREKHITYKELINIADLDEEIAIEVMLDGENYHVSHIVGMGITDSKGSYYVSSNNALEVLKAISNKKIITFDAKKIIGNTHIVINCISDLMIASYLLNINTKDDLATLGSVYNYQLEYYDNLKKNHFSSEFIQEEIVKRSKLIYNIKNTLEKDMQDNKTWELYKQIEMPLLYVLADMEITGIRCERKILDDMAIEYNEKIKIIMKEIYDMAGFEFNINSPKQLGEVLFERLNISTGKKNKTGYKTDAKVLEKLVDKHPIVSKILEYRALTKLKSTYIDGLVNYILDDGKIHTIYKQTLTRTGRLSSVEPNLQNIPVREEMGRIIRKAFLPSFDVLLSADYSQVELRIMAHLSDSQGLKEAFLNDEDIHTHVASEIYGVSDDEVTKQMRRCAKAVIFGIIYGISSFGLGENLHIPKRDADDFITKFHTLYPEVKAYTDERIREAKETGGVNTLFGRRRMIEEVNSPNYMIRQMGERMAMNTPIQGTSADIMKMAMIKVYKRFQRENITSKMLLQVHDEIIVDCKKEELSKVDTIVREEMENVYKLSVPLKVEIDTGLNWYQAK